MRVATVQIEGLAPYSQSRFADVPKLPKESANDHETRTWRERLHANADGFVVIPPMAFKNCLSEVAKYLSVQIPGKGKATYTKHFEAGVIVTEGLTLGVRKADVDGEWLFVPADGKRGSGKRVKKCFPIIREWGGTVVFYIVDETITPDAFEQHLREAGNFIGVGRFRPRNNGYYGRFKVTRVTWS